MAKWTIGYDVSVYLEVEAATAKDALVQADERIGVVERWLDSRDGPLPRDVAIALHPVDYIRNDDTEEEILKG